MAYLAWKAWHVIAIITWFSGLFYLPRLFVYHTEAEDELGCQRFQVMEHKLYYYITWPSAIVTILCGIGLLHSLAPAIYHQRWLHIKLALVVVLCFFHLSCGHFVKRFKQDASPRSSRFFRVYNEIPSVLLIAIVLLAIYQPQ